MGSSSRAVAALACTGKLVNDALSLLVFSFLDLLDFVLCFVYRVADFCIEARWLPCYCSSASKEAITALHGGEVLVSEKGEPKVVRIVGSGRLQLEEISDTLYSRPSSFSEISRLSARELPRLRADADADADAVAVQRSDHEVILGKGSAGKGGTFTVNSTVIEVLQGKLSSGERPIPIPRWSDCDCSTCSSWSLSPKESLYVRVDAPRGKPREDVLFIHGFISNSQFWTETVFPELSEAVKSSYRLLAVDLLGFGRSPKPADSFYTLREHLDFLENTVLQPHRVTSFHIVAHSLGCILALALAAKRPGSVKSLTLLSPPYFPLPEGEAATPAQYVLRRIAPRRVWPPIAFAASVAGWYEHVSRTVCLLICKNHRLWEFLTKLITLNRVRTFLCDGFCCHTHNAAWHTLHNIICGSAGKMEGYLEAVRGQRGCAVEVLHGADDDLIPEECSHALGARVPRARVRVLRKRDHITIVVGRQRAFARELEQIWRASSG